MKGEHVEGDVEIWRPTGKEGHESSTQQCITYEPILHKIPVLRTSLLIIYTNEGVGNFSVIGKYSLIFPLIMHNGLSDP